MTDVNLDIVAGAPYRRVFVVEGATSIWPGLDDFEVRSQVRKRRTHRSELVADLGSYLTTSIAGDDIVVRLMMTGAQTRTMGAGFYDIVLSDKGTTDARLLRIVGGDVTVDQTMVTVP